MIGMLIEMAKNEFVICANISLASTISTISTSPGSISIDIISMIWKNDTIAILNRSLIDVVQPL